MPGLPLRPIITYGTPSKIIDLSMPQKWWGYKTQLIGGSRKSSAGIPESFTIREDNMSMLTLRVHECELMDVREWIVDYWRRNQPFTFQYDALDTETIFTTYLDAPTYDDGWEPRRMTNPNFPQFWEVDVTIRNTLKEIPIFVSVTGDCSSTSVTQQAWVLTNFANPETGELRLSVPPPPATFGSGEEFANLPDPMTDPAILYISSPAEKIWDTLILTDGLLIPLYVQMETFGPTPSEGFDRAGGFFKIKHMRGSTILAEGQSPQTGFGSLVTSYPSFDVTSIGTLRVEIDDFIRLELYGYQSLYPDTADSGYRCSYFYGAVFGPRPNPHLVCLSNVEEQL